ncbi:MAG: DEAD/DEAH box helicase family protein [Bacteroidaceae bacterium]|nr:DEAD/DEAH box helicase family protein [Bacteroidaceae bacterium]MBR1683458.1 DEAD/DEAH box helicase family protein [Bacteroidaceae bacterium]
MHKNFDYLKELPLFTTLYQRCDEAEVFCKADPDKAAMACRRALEWTIELIYRVQHWEVSPRANLFEKVQDARFAEFIHSRDLMRKLHFVRSVGNRAAHQGGVSRRDCEYAVLDIYYFVGDVLKLLGYIDRYPSFDPTLLPERGTRVMTVTTNEAAATRQQTEAAEEAKPIQTPTAEVLVAHNPENLSEAETRKIYIDEMLREAGWEISEAAGVIVSGKACIEIEVQGMPDTPSGRGYADYVLFDTDGMPLAVVEAKRTTVDPVAGKTQAELYAQCLEARFGVKPVVYYTNGYETHVIDGLGYPARTIYGFHTRQDLQKLIQKRGRQDIVDMLAKEEIVDRPYQTRAVKSICEHFNTKHRRGLLVMATGTGKTRVAIALIEVLLRNNWVRNVLFLADRTDLVDQAFGKFNTYLPDETKCNLCDPRQTRNLDARLLFSTYQTMINFIDAEEKTFSVGRFDLIIIDEAHRSVFGKFRAIFDYFDSLLVGLTATPREEIDRSTYRLLELEDGEPNDFYEYGEAVRDGHLVNFEAYRYDSDILRNGIRYRERSEDEQRQLDTIFESEGEGERDIESNEIFRYVYNTDTIDKVLQELMEKGLRVDSGENIGKTIIFAYNHRHAVKIAERFAVLYPQLGPDYCEVIDYQATQRKHLLGEFEKVDHEPRVAVSVDMLDTGIDVPEVLNLVFFKPVHSKIKFEQMKGRGTRLCKNLLGAGRDKEKFLIFDFCNNFDYFDEHPQGATATRTRSLTERIFCQKSELAFLLQRVARTDFERQLHGELKNELWKQVGGLGFERILVRKHGEEIDPFRAEQYWEHLREADVAVLQTTIAPLLVASGDEMAMMLDALMYACEIARLQRISSPTAVTEKIKQLCQILRTKKGNIPQVREQMATIEEVIPEHFWTGATLEDLERVRKVLRELARFAIDVQDNATFDVDIEDMIDNPRIDTPQATNITYKQRVFDYLAEHRDDEVFRKIFNMKQLTIQDVHELERILWEELGTKEQYEDYCQRERKIYGGNVAALIRSLCGIDRTKAHQLFYEFLRSENLSSLQEEYLNSIINYVCMNGDMERRTLGQDPYRSFNWQLAFGDNRAKVGNYVDHLHFLIKGVESYSQAEEASPDYLMAAENL